MELNWTQCLGLDESVLAQFKRDHGILDDVLIEGPGPNVVIAIVQGNRDRILVQKWLIYQAELRFPISPLLKEFMAQ